MSLGLMGSGDSEESGDVGGLINWAIKNQSFLLYRQPVYGMYEDGRVIFEQYKEPTNYELFVRMRDREGNIRLAGKFLDKASPEQIKAIDRIVLGMAVSLLDSSSGCSYSVNLSLETLGDFQFPVWFDELLKGSKVNPRRLSIEITEQVAYYLPPMSVLTILRAMRIDVGMDNFGVGGANFQAVRLIKPDFLKVDGSIVQLLITDPWCESIVFSAMALAYYKRIPVILENIESGIMESKILKLARLLPGLQMQMQGRLYGLEELITV